MPNARLHFEHSGGDRDQQPGPWREQISAPDWVRLLLTEGNSCEGNRYQEVRLTYADGSYTVWRMRIY